MPLEPTTQCSEAELPSVVAFGAQIKPRKAHPAGHHILAAMAGFKNAQGLGREILTFVLGHGQIVILDLAKAGAAETG